MRQINSVFNRMFFIRALVFGLRFCAKSFMPYSVVKRDNLDILTCVLSRGNYYGRYCFFIFKRWCDFGGAELNSFHGGIFLCCSYPYK